MPGLLLSVRDLPEARIALSNGVALLDVKEPTRGSLGRADEPILASILDAVGDSCPVSAALGELNDWPDDTLPPHIDRLHFVKWGFAHAEPRWSSRIQALRTQIESASPCRVVLAAYADHRRAAAPSPRDIAHLAIYERFSVLLLDTCIKDGTTLLDWLSFSEIAELVQPCHAAGVRVALAGSLGQSDIHSLLPLHPDWFAVRGAACTHGFRATQLDPERVRLFADLLRSVPNPPH